MDSVARVIIDAGADDPASGDADEDADELQPLPKHCSELERPQPLFRFTNHSGKQTIELETVRSDAHDGVEPEKTPESF